MKLLVVVISLVAIGYARPDVSHLGYGSLNIPSGSYLPTGGVIPGPGGIFDGSDYNPEVLVQKHVYFYTAPEEEEPQPTLRIHVAPASQRNTKVIFIKAPSYGGVRPEIIAPPSISEDKTIVYVLVKKQDQGGSITIPSNIISKPTKPEIYFIKYKTQQEAENIVAGGLQEQAVGPNLPDLGNENLFIKTIKEDGIKSGGVIGTNGNGIIGGSLGGDNLDGSGIISGSSLLGSVSGDKLGGIESTLGGKYGPPGASGPY